MSAEWPRRSDGMKSLTAASTAHSELERPSYDKVKDEDAFKKAVAAGVKTASSSAAGGNDPVAKSYP